MSDRGRVAGKDREPEEGLPPGPVAPYRPWDRDEKLGPVPEGGFKPDDPKVIAWEAAHGHDLRLKCLPEFGCQLLGLTEPERKAVITALRIRMRTEYGTFHELLRSAVEKLEAGDA